MKISSKYKADPHIFEQVECSKCKFLKVPRSKHCLICDKCIDKFDHHCVWINQCVGANNYRYFLLFITIHCILCAYAGTVGLIILYDYAVRRNLFNAQFINKSTNEVYNSSYMNVFKYVIFKHYAFFSTNVILVTIAITLVAFCGYHCYLVSINLTTNESSKRAKLIKFMKLIRQTLNNLANEKKLNINYQINITDEDFVKFKHIAFKSK